MQAARDRQKSYADLKRKPMDFQVGDKVMLKVSPWKGVVRFGKRGKLNPRYIGPFKVLEKVGSVAYKVELPEELSRVHNTFHVAFCHFRDAFSVVFGLSLTQDTVMSDSEDSTVTYTVVSSPFTDLPDIGSPRVDGPPVMPEDPYAYVVAAFQAPPSLDYVPGPEHPPSPDFVPEPVYLEFMLPEDEVLPAEDQPSPVAASPTADSPGYSSDDDEDDDVDIKEDEEEEEHPAPADSIAVALPAIDHAPSAKETESFETDESTLAIPTPPTITHFPQSSPITSEFFLTTTPILSPLPLSPPLPISSPSLASPIRCLGYRAAMIRLRAEAPSTSHSPPPHIILSHTRADTPPSGTPPSGTPPLLPIPLPTSSPPLHLLSTDRRAYRPEVTLQPRKRLGIALSPRYEVEESLSAAARPTRGLRADYGFVATMDKEIMRDLERDVDYGITDT
ncbi:hypothetical protein Tco_0134456 [Tanacetum coccineum]